MRRSRREWQAIISEFERSGESHVAFCRRRDLKVGNFRSWLYVIRRSPEAARAMTVAPSKVRMVPVRVREAVVGAEVVEIGVAGAVVRVRSGTDAEYVAAIVAAIQSRC